MHSSGPGTGTVTSEYTEDVEQEPEQKPQSKQVDRQTWEKAKPKLQTLVDKFNTPDRYNVYKSHSFTIKSV